MWTMRKGLSWAILLVLLDMSLARDAKFFSLFNVIKFKNEGCVGTGGDHGTCTTEDKCTASGGNAIGNCAAGFGICCRSTISNCGSTVENNCTYIQNPGYPSFQSSIQTCTYNFGRISDDLCQIRLDFISTQMGVDDTGLCTDSITVTSPTGVNPPVVCGDLSGQHMYLETGNAGNAGSIAFAYAAAGTQRHRIKVTYLECDNLAKAPEFCTQYFTGISGSFQSYAYASEVLLHDQRYRTCFRREQGYCNTDFSTTTMDSFKLLNGGIADQAKTSECTVAFVSLGLTAPPSAMICGERFDTEDGSILNGLVRARVEPFFLDTFSAEATADEMGYDLTFRQSPCS
ncbi:uncharacterized protein LOC131886884 isoform X2 [Tigriopus californicus]|uniref:uncharacterized protein LOC131886884 isoform X2 n=1 Tax=Tigriopus californicus TaxID=6832 RepID=UPI0027DA659E|nr:uncharacterized protein LOC131886884 isoform X2 [Tigriopus californicus]